jgi:hypothetical protein
MRVRWVLKHKHHIGEWLNGVQVNGHALLSAYPERAELFDSREAAQAVIDHPRQSANREFRIVARRLP